MADPATDAEIIEQVLDGDVEAFGVLVDRYQDEFAAYARYMTGSEDEAADVIQESLVRAYRGLRRCRDPANFKGWLFRIVSNQCKTHVTRHRRRAQLLAQAAPEPAPSEQPDEAVQEADLRRQVHEALQELPAEQREALVLRYVQGLSVGEMAKLLGASISAVKMRLLRARSALRERFEGVAL
ncbi:MAG TPA: RNA polymerase sigma factor [Gemmatimonadales bacterium]|nr:RNA polymerase sigma factor [Gemmatimonadales bacterium]